MRGWRRYFSFQGRASRSEYILVPLLTLLAIWGSWVILIVLISAIGIAFAALRIKSDACIPIIALPVMVSELVIFFWVNLAVMVRRKHDLGYAGTVILRSLVTFDLVRKPGVHGANAFGPDPLA